VRNFLLIRAATVRERFLGASTKNHALALVARKSAVGSAARTFLPHARCPVAISTAARDPLHVRANYNPRPTPVNRGMGRCRVFQTSPGMAGNHWWTSHQWHPAGGGCPHHSSPNKTWRRFAWPCHPWRVVEEHVRLKGGHATPKGMPPQTGRHPIEFRRASRDPAREGRWVAERSVAERDEFDYKSDPADRSRRALTPGT